MHVAKLPNQNAVLEIDELLQVITVSQLINLTFKYLKNQVYSILAQTLLNDYRVKSHLKVKIKQVENYIILYSINKKMNLQFVKINF